MNSGHSLRLALEKIEGERYSRPGESRGPFKVGDWVYGTNGTILVAAQASLCPDVTASGRYDSKVSPWLTEACQDGWTLTVDRLRAFTGINSLEPEPCSVCGGDGQVKCRSCNGEGGAECECDDCGHMHERECRECRSEGAVPCKACDGARLDKHYSRFCGAVINRAALAQALQAVDPCGEPVAVVRLKNMALRLTSSEGWIVIVMPLREGTKPVSDFDKPETWTSVVTVG